MKTALSPQNLGASVAIGILVAVASLGLQILLPTSSGAALVGATGAIAGVISALWLSRRKS